MIHWDVQVVTLHCNDVAGDEVACYGATSSITTSSYRV